MKLTKYEHSCMTLEDQGAKIVIDPGQFSPSFTSTTGILAVVVTHDHIDHIDTKKIHQIIHDNPEVKVFSVQEVADAHADIPIITVNPSDIQQVGPFVLEFFGGDHAVNHPSWTPLQNIGVLINDTLYYPGDSFALPHRDIKVLAIPASAPWLKLHESMDFLVNVHAPLTIPAHDVLLSEAGQVIHDGMLNKTATEAELTYKRLAIGETIEL